MILTRQVSSLCLSLRLQSALCAQISLQLRGPCRVSTSFWLHDSCKE